MCRETRIALTNPAVDPLMALLRPDDPLLLSCRGGHADPDPARGELTPRSGPIVASWLGRIGYTEAHGLQKRLVAERAESRIPDQLLLLEHPAVLTLGRHSDPRHILADEATLHARGIVVERVERGGGAC